MSSLSLGGDSETSRVRSGGTSRRSGRDKLGCSFCCLVGRKRAGDLQEVLLCPFVFPQKRAERGEEKVFVDSRAAQRKSTSSERTIALLTDQLQPTLKLLV